MGWYTTPGGAAPGVQITGGMTIPHTLNENAPTDLFARWEPLSGILYNIRVYAQQADGTTYAWETTIPRSGSTGDPVSYPAGLWGNEFFTFNAAHVNNVLTGTIAANGSTVLVVHYDRVMVSLNYNLAGGTGLTSPQGPYRWGYEATIPNPPTRVGFNFAGWTVTAGLDASVSGDTVTMGRTDTTLTAQWSSTFVPPTTTQPPDTTEPPATTQPPESTFVDLVVGGAVVGQLEVRYGEVFNAVDVLSETAELDENWRFLGWSNDDGATFIDADNDIVTSFDNIEAHFVRVYSVTYNANGGVIETENTATTQRSVWYTGAFGDGIGGTPAVPAAVREGYTFLGWFMEVNGAQLQVTSLTQVPRLTTDDPRNPYPSLVVAAALALASADPVPTIYARWAPVGGGEQRPPVGPVRPFPPGDFGDVNLAWLLVPALGVGGLVAGGLALGAMGTLITALTLPITAMLFLFSRGTCDRVPCERQPDDECYTYYYYVYVDEDGNVITVPTPRTGDNRALLFGTWLLLMLSGGGMIMLLRKKREAAQVI